MIASRPLIFCHFLTKAEGELVDCSGRAAAVGINPSHKMNCNWICGKAQRPIRHINDNAATFVLILKISSKVSVKERIKSVQHASARRPC